MSLCHSQYCKWRRDSWPHSWTADRSNAIPVGNTDMAPLMYTVQICSRVDWVRDSAGPLLGFPKHVKTASFPIPIPSPPSWYLSDCIALFSCITCFKTHYEITNAIPHRASYTSVTYHIPASRITYQHHVSHTSITHHIAASRFTYITHHIPTPSTT